MRSYVITGAPSGIGFHTAKLLLAKGYRVFGNALIRAEAEAAAHELGANFHPLVFDITDEAAARAAAREVRTALGGETLAGLVNNAGIAIKAQPLLHLPIAEFRRQIEINLTGQLIVTQAFAPLLGADPSLRGAPGRIVMMSSIVGKLGWPLVGHYVASKHGLEGLSESLRRELMPYGIDVVIVAPGIVNTPLWKSIPIAPGERYPQLPYSVAMRKFRENVERMVGRGISPERVARLVRDVLLTRRPRIRYAIGRYPMPEFLVRIIPKRIVDYTIARKFWLLQGLPDWDDP